MCQPLKVETSDPFDVEGTQQKVLGLLKKGGVKVLILKQSCALFPEKKGRKLYELNLDASVCASGAITKKEVA